MEPYVMLTFGNMCSPEIAAKQTGRKYVHMVQLLNTFWPDIVK